ncbi:MAG: antibiotic biosynthesis monooxygenase [Pseudomonadota bacterium]
MLIVAGTIRVPAENMEAARPAMDELVRATRAEAGCELYAYAEDLFDAGLIHISERWTDAASFAAHGAAPHLAEWRVKGAQLGVHGRDLRLYTVDGFKTL